MNDRHQSAMGTIEVSFPPGGQPGKLVKWRVRVDTMVSTGRVLFFYSNVAPGTEDAKGPEKKYRATRFGRVTKLLVKEGEIVEPGQVIMLLEGCRHPTVMKDLCAECGVDLRLESAGKDNEKIEVSQASVPMVHSVPELKVCPELAEKIGKADEERLLKDRKLVLLVDLDQTVVHTTNDNVPPNMKDVAHYQLYGPNSPWYHTRLRPNTRHFLSEMSRLYELHICTFGARNYAHTVAALLDKDGNLFSHRILSRDECFDPASKTANLKALFPCGDDLVCIIDDREDVWQGCGNLVQVKPYHFFRHTGDIHAPPGLEKNDLPATDGQVENNGPEAEKNGIEEVSVTKDEAEMRVTEEKVDDTVKSVITNNSEKNESPEPLKKCETAESETSDKAESSNTEKPESSSTEKEESTPNTDKQESIPNTEKQETTPNSEKEETTPNSEKQESTPNPEKQESTPNPEKQESTPNPDKQESTPNPEKQESTPNPEQPATQDDKTEMEVVQNETASSENGNSKSEEKTEQAAVNPEPKTKKEGIKPDHIHNTHEDDDDYLLYLEDILRRIHAEFYTEMEKKGARPSLRDIIPLVRSQVLKGVHITFSGLIPTQQKLQQSRAYKVARAFGAEVTQDLTESTTHLVAIRPGTAKANTARKNPNIKIVNPDWLWTCAERWEHVDERLFPLTAKARASRIPPPHCSSPECIEGEEKASDNFADSINPLMSFTPEEIEIMDKEVDEDMDDQEMEASRFDFQDADTVEEEDYYEPSSKRAKIDTDSSENDSFSGDKEEENSDEDDDPVTRFRRGEDLPDDLDLGDLGDNSQDSIEDLELDEDDDREWNAMGAALEREFLSE